jgi:hypothetical protein
MPPVLQHMSVSTECDIWGGQWSGARTLAEPTPEHMHLVSGWLHMSVLACSVCSGHLGVQALGSMSGGLGAGGSLSSHNFEQAYLSPNFEFLRSVFCTRFAMAILRRRH